jgi:hypothetical protein
MSTAHMRDGTGALGMPAARVEALLQCLTVSIIAAKTSDFSDEQ